MSHGTLLRDLVARAPRTPVTVAGDLIVDHYVHGSSGRVSREAPVLILRFMSENWAAGGAANAAMNLRALGVPVAVLGTVGDDQPGRALLEILARAGVDVGGVVVSPERATVVKMRLLAGDTNVSRQQVVRLDRDQPDRLEPALEGALLDRVARALEGAKALLLADYGQGTLSGALRDRLIAVSRERGLVSCADSRRRLGAFRGVTVAVPNESEAIPVLAGEEPGEPRDRHAPPAGHEDERLARMGERILEKLDLRALIVTRGSAGMMVFERGADPFTLGVVGGVEVVDVTGAGDTVAAAVTLALAAGGTARDAALLASHAAGLVVMKRGTATVSAAELVRSLESAWPAA